jgi:hypothetical protein
MVKQKKISENNLNCFVCFTATFLKREKQKMTIKD